MSNEITTSISHAASKGGASISTGAMSATQTMANTYMQTGTQAVGVGAGTAEQLSYNSTDFTTGPITRVNFAVKNLSSSTNAGSVGIYTGSTVSTDNVIGYMPVGGICFLAGIDPAKIFFDSITEACTIQWWMEQV